MEIRGSDMYIGDRDHYVIVHADLDAET